MLTVTVRWQKENFKNVEIDTSQPPYVLKCQMYDLTGVPPDKQKIMVKGGLLKDDADWSTLGVKEGQKLLMIGSATDTVKVPDASPVFVEDLPEESHMVGLGYTAGLINLGNTCYMNSTIQCLHAVPELKSSLLSYSSDGIGGIDQLSHLLTLEAQDLFKELNRTVKPVHPTQFWRVFCKKYPQFRQLHDGIPMQQDAEECWTQLLYSFSQSLKVPCDSEQANTVKLLFSIELLSRIYCPEGGEESTETESVYSLKCHISHEVNHLHEGLKLALKSEMEKASSSLGRTALYIKDSRLNSLPRYLTIQFVRFFWKRETNQKAKILRKVDYPMVLDVFDFCTDTLKNQLEAPRRISKAEDDNRAGIRCSGADTNTADSNDSSGSCKVSLEPNAENGKELHLTGVYDLLAVLTHKGRSADSGHYVAWVKQEDGKWVQYDDANLILQREEDIVKLSGGGDWHMAYLCMYKARLVSM